MTQLTSTSALLPTDKTLGDAEPINLRRIFRLVRLCLPFLRPMAWHIVVLIVVGAIGVGILAIAGTIANDLITNKVLVGDKLQPLQAKAMLLDDSYVKEEFLPTTSIDPGESVAEEQLTEEQRIVVRNRMIVLIIVCALILLTLVAAIPYYDMWIWQSVNQSLRLGILERLESLSYRYHNNAQVGDAIFRIYQDSSLITQLIEGVILAIGMQLLTMLGMLVYLLFFDWQLVLLAVGTLIPIFIIMVKFTPRIRRRAIANRRANSGLTSTMQEVFNAVQIVKSNHAEIKVQADYDIASRRALNAAFKVRQDIALVRLLIVLIGGLAIIFAEFIMVQWTISKQLTFLGGLVAMILSYKVWNLGAFQSASTAFVDTQHSGFGLTQLWYVSQDLFIALERVFWVFELALQIEDTRNPVQLPSQVDRIHWSGVSFGYVPEKQIFRDLELSVEKGTITAIVGPTGIGKSTLVGMLLRQNDPDRGEIYINDIDILEYGVDNVRRHVAIALQRNVLFSGTIAENISYAREEVSQEDIEAAARVACADEFIGELPDKFHTDLGKSGQKLSTGQRQRLSIARAIVRDTPVLILDEPSAALDAVTEQRLLRNLAEWGKEKIVLLITHRLSTIQLADRIAFLEDGVVAEIGSHEALMAIQSGRYRRYLRSELALTATAA